MPDRTTKFLLLLIAIGLLLNGIVPLLRPRNVAAQDSFTCSGDVTVKANGAAEPSVGGYSVKVMCSK